jgi:hypothetical protein
MRMHHQIVVVLDHLDATKVAFFDYKKINHDCPLSGQYGRWT